MRGRSIGLRSHPPTRSGVDRRHSNEMQKTCVSSYNNARARVKRRGTVACLDFGCEKLLTIGTVGNWPRMRFATVDVCEDGTLGVQLTTASMFDEEVHQQSNQDKWRKHQRRHKQDVPPRRWHSPHCITFPPFYFATRAKRVSYRADSYSQSGSVRNAVWHLPVAVGRSLVTTAYKLDEDFGNRVLLRAGVRRGGCCFTSGLYGR
jgi:hypothetical protein